MEDFGKLVVALQSVPLWAIPIALVFFWLRDLDKTSTVLSKLWGRNRDLINSYLIEQKAASSDLLSTLREIQERQVFRAATGIDANKNQRAALINLYEILDGTFNWPQLKHSVPDIKFVGRRVSAISKGKWAYWIILLYVIGLFGCIGVMIFLVIVLRTPGMNVEGLSSSMLLMTTVGYFFMATVFLSSIAKRLWRKKVYEKWSMSQSEN